MKNSKSKQEKEAKLNNKDIRAMLFKNTLNGDLNTSNDIKSASKLDEKVITAKHEEKKDNSKERKKS